MGIVSIVMSLISPIIFARLVVNLTQNKIKQFIYMIIIVNIIYIFEDFINYFKSIIYDKIFVNIYTKIQVDLGREFLYKDYLMIQKIYLKYLLTLTLL